MSPKYQIFISSTYVDLKTERDLVVKAILEMGHIPVGMEMFSAGDESQWQVIARTIEQSDYYLVVVAHRYGSREQETGIAYTEKEYSYAENLGIPILGFVIDGSAAWRTDLLETEQDQRAALTKFKDRVRKKICSSWETGVDLAGKVSVSLTKAFHVSPRPGWVRASDAVTPQMAQEMARLSQENKDLRDRLADSGGGGNNVRADWKSYFDHCVDIREVVPRLRVAQQLRAKALNNPQHIEAEAEARRKMQDAILGARKALGRLKLEKNPVGAEVMAKAEQTIGELQSAKLIDIEPFRAEVAAALNGPLPAPPPATRAGSDPPGPG